MKSPDLRYSKAVGTHLVIHIDRSAQAARSKLSAGLIVPPAYEYMMYNLQYGYILSVGEGVTNPEIRPGRLAIIHHTIESDDKFLIDVDPDTGDQIRWLNSVSLTYSYQLFGVIDEKGYIIPLPDFVFCEPELSEEPEYQEFSFGGEKMRFATEKVGDLFLARVPKTEKEEKRFIKTKVLHVSPTEETLAPGQLVMAQDFTKYPITLPDQEYWILSREFIISTTTV